MPLPEENVFKCVVDFIYKKDFVDKVSAAFVVNTPGADEGLKRQLFFVLSTLSGWVVGSLK
jgi:hypothetical protein